MISLYDDFIMRWQHKQMEMERLGVLVPGALLVGQILHDMAEVQVSYTETILRVEEAAQLSGYSAEHIARLIRQGRLPNAGRRGSPRVRLGDLPQRRQFARTRPGSYDVLTDARSLRTQR
jgi:predicted DNA-binding transcriptional regulator AlpA